MCSFIFLSPLLIRLLPLIHILIPSVENGIELSYLAYFLAEGQESEKAVEFEM